jgi:hypothetical protein
MSQSTICSCNKLVCSFCTPGTLNTSISAYTTPISGTYTITSTGNSSPINVNFNDYTETYRVSLDNLINLTANYGEIKGKCSRCKETKSIRAGYKVLAIERKLCEPCLIDAVDNIFGIETNAKMESNLFGK